MKRILFFFAMIIGLSYGAQAQLPGLTTGTLLKFQKGNESWLDSVGALASFITAGSGTVTSVQVSGGSTGLTFSGGPITTSGTISMAGTLAAGFGGTGQSTYAIGDILVASTSTALSRLAGVATGNALISGGVGTAPSWGKIGLSTHVTGTLPVSNGGTGLTSLGGDGTILGSNGTVNVYFNPTITTNAAAIAYSRSGSNLQLNLPDADASNRGTMGTGAQTFAGAKTFQALLTGSAGVVSTATSNNAGLFSTGVQGDTWTTHTANITLDHTHSFVEIGPLSASITVTLPACNATRNGWEYKVHKTGNDTFGVVIDPNATEIFTDGASTKTIYSRGNEATCKCKWNGSTGTWYYSTN